jgi:modulator of FtsH protease HflK
MNVSSKRAEYVSIVGLILSLLFFITAWVVGAISGAYVVMAISWQILSCCLIWFVLAVQFHQMSLAEQEKLDIDQLSKTKASDTIFQGSAGRSELFAVASKRLALIEKWFVPIFAALIAVYEIFIGFSLFNRVSEKIVDPPQYAQLSAVFMVIIAFVSFLISRYATGMSAQMKWKALRAGGSGLLATAIFSFAAAISLALAQFKIIAVVNVLAWVVPVVLIVIGIETGLNIILDVYRPRISGQYSRSAFDSRLLGIFNEPGGIFHTFASTIDYQFGFQVSQTWFYKLLGKAIIPLVLFLVLTQYLLSCFVVVRPGEEAVIEHFGSFYKIVGPGYTFKLPWPFEIAYKHPTSEVRRIDIGFVESEEEREKNKNKPMLWGEQHYEEEYNLLVATEAGGSSGEGAVPVSIVRAAVPVHYKIKDLKQYLYNHSATEEMLTVICYRELVRFTTSSKIETSEDEGASLERESLLGGGRGKAAKILTERIQAASDKEELGVEIVFLGLQGVHPPPEVAEDYQKVVGSVQKRQAEILTALAQRNSILATLCGSVREANELYELAHRYQQAKESSENIEELAALVQEAFGSAKGEIFKTLSESQSYAFARAKRSEADGKRFNDQVLAYRASPKIYKRIKRLEMLEDALSSVRKYIVVADESDYRVYIVDLKEKLEPSLYDLSLDELGAGNK